MSRESSRRAYFAALVLGVAAVPALAFGASALTANIQHSGEAEMTSASVADDAASVSTTLAGAGAIEAAVTMEIESVDWAAACGSDGMGLVAKEADGSISPLEQAALDALRPLCAERDLALPEPPSAEPVVIIETVVAAPAVAADVSVASTASGTSHDDDEYDDDEYDDDEYDDDEYDDDEYDDEYDDGHHEDEDHHEDEH